MELEKISIAQGPWGKTRERNLHFLCASVGFSYGLTEYSGIFFGCCHWCLKRYANRWAPQRKNEKKKEPLPEPEETGVSLCQEEWQGRHHRG